jgi:hypothetical protein
VFPAAFAALDREAREMPASVRTEPFYALAAALRASGFTDHATRLESVLNGVWTTSSELIGELGLVVTAIRKECRPLAPEQKALLKECMKQVHMVWPGFGLFDWLQLKWFEKRRDRG